MRVRLLIAAALALSVGAAAVLFSAPKKAAPPSGWKAADPPAAPGAMAPGLSLSRKGPLLSWLEPDGQGYRLRISRFVAGRWSTPVTVAGGRDFFANWADVPAVVEATDGALVAHWLGKTQEGTYDYEVRLARSAPPAPPANGTSPWSRIGVLHEDGVPAEHGFVSWIQEGPGLRAFWLDGREMPKGGPMTLRTTWVGQVGKTAEPSALLDARVCDCCQTDAAVAAGGPVVVYRDRSDKEIRDIYVIRRTAAGWSPPVRVAADNWYIPGCPVNGPAIAASGRRVAVAWFTGAAPGPRVQVAFSGDGGASFGKPTRIDGGRPLGRVDVALDASGEAVVSWLELAGAGAEVRLRRVGSDGRAGQPVTAAVTGATHASGFPRLVRTGDLLHLAWVEEGPPTRLRAASLPARALPLHR
ncbi:MAG TPA: hypothetical protein VMW27_08780 [Thermoanaerobaculia bacterium]|nr:hypothetical protein [Thermoanaerobaculia bacterium]